MTFAVAPVNAENCNQKITTKLINLGGGGQPATVLVKNITNYAVQVTAASYKVYREPYVESGWLNTQELFFMKQEH